jgi:hypothetical protein
MRRKKNKTKTTTKLFLAMHQGIWGEIEKRQKLIC